MAANRTVRDRLIKNPPMVLCGVNRNRSIVVLRSLFYQKGFLAVCGGKTYVRRPNGLDLRCPAEAGRLLSMVAHADGRAGRT